MNTLIKVGAAVAGLGTVTTASYFIRDYQNTERIYKRINSSGMTLLDYNEKEEEWRKRWDEYMNDSGDVWGLKKLGKDKIPREFKDKCYYNTSTAIEGNEKLLSQIEKYCTKSFKLEDLLGKEKGIKLITKEDTDAWKVAWSNYLAKRKNQNPLDISSSVFQQHLPAEYSHNCLTKAAKQIRTTRDSDYSTVKIWCTKTS